MLFSVKSTVFIVVTSLLIISQSVFARKSDVSHWLNAVVLCPLLFCEEESVGGLASEPSSLVFEPGGDTLQLDFGAKDSQIFEDAYLVTPNSQGSAIWGKSNSSAGSNNRNNALNDDWVSGIGEQKLTVYLANGLWSLKINFGGERPINNLSINAQGHEFATVDSEVASYASTSIVDNVLVHDNKLVIDLLANNNQYWAIQSIEITNGKINIDTERNQFQYDAGSQFSVKESGWERLSPATWGDVYWRKAVRDQAKYWDNKILPVNRDIVQSESGADNEAVLSHRVANGIWKIEGGATGVRGRITNMRVTAENELIANNLASAPSSTQAFEGSVRVTDGILDLKFEGIDSMWGISFLKLTKLSSLPELNGSKDNYAVFKNGHAQRGRALVNRAKKDSWDKILLVNRTQVIKNTKPYDVFINLGSFNFYAQELRGPITPFAIKLVNTTFTGIALVGDSLNSYRIGENKFPFTKRKTAPIKLASGEALAFGFMTGGHDGVNASGNPIPYDVGGDDYLYSGRFSSAKIAEGLPSFIAGERSGNTNRSYSFSVDFISTEAEYLGNAENNGIRVANYKYPEQRDKTCKNHTMSELFTPTSLSRQNDRYCGHPYTLNRTYITNEQARLGDYAYMAEARTSTKQDKKKQRMEYGLRDITWKIDESDAEHYWAFSFRLDSSRFGQIQDGEWFNMLQFNQGGSGIPGKAGFHQLVKLQLFGNTDPTLVSMKANVLYGVSSETEHTYQGTPAGFDIAELKKDQWYDLILGVRIDTDGNNGFAKVWLKEADENQYRLTQHQGRMGFIGGELGAGGSYGIYKKEASRTYVIYYDEIRKGNTFESVDIRNYELRR
ncbi:MAG: polysaccharide lyase [Acidiferrobacterales bacterium]|nr:polysaccharide lyase [Acidiferrobacterales bacterium]